MSFSSKSSFSLTSTDEKESFHRERNFKGTEIEKLKEKVRKQKIEILDLSKRLEISTKKNQEEYSKHDHISGFTDIWKEKYFDEKGKNEALEKKIISERENNSKLCKKIGHLQIKIEKNNSEKQEMLVAASHFAGQQIENPQLFIDYFSTSTLLQQIRSATRPIQKLTLSLQKEEDATALLKEQVRTMKIQAERQNERMKTRESEYNRTISALKDQISIQNESFTNEEPFINRSTCISIPVTSLNGINNTYNCETTTTLNDDNEDLRKTVKKLRKRILELENQKNVFKSAVQTQRVILDNKYKKETKSNAKIDRMQSVLEDSCRKADLQNSLITNTKQKEEIEYLNHQIEDLKREKESYIEQISSLEKEVNDNNKKVENIVSDALRIKEENKSLKEQSKKFKKCVDIYQQKLESIDVKREQITLNVDRVPKECATFINKVLGNETLQTQEMFDISIKKLVDFYETNANLQELESRKLKNEYEKMKEKISNFISTISPFVLGCIISFDTFMGDPISMDTFIRIIKQKCV